MGRVLGGLPVVLAALLLFTHPWTFDQLLGSVLVFALYAGYEGWRGRRYERFFMLVVYVGLMGFFEFCKGFVFQGVGGVGASSTVTGNLAGLGGFWGASIFGFRLLYGGFESNVLLISLSLIGVFLLRRGVALDEVVVKSRVVEFSGRLMSGLTVDQVRAVDLFHDEARFCPELIDGRGVLHPLIGTHPMILRALQG